MNMPLLLTVNVQAILYYGRPIENKGSGEKRSGIFVEGTVLLVVSTEFHTLSGRYVHVCIEPTGNLTYIYTIEPLSKVIAKGFLALTST